MNKASASVVLLFVAASFGLAFAQQPDVASQIYAESSKSVFLLLVKSERVDLGAQGTGFLVSSGKIITNEHVVRNGDVFLHLGTVRLPLRIERLDTLNDLALLGTDADLAVKALTIATDIPQPGTTVYAIGNPAGLERTISVGVVSGVREFDGRQLIQITTPISPGSSGGPVLNSRGEVVGVAVGSIESGQNLNFAVPATFIRKLLRGDVSSDGASGGELLDVIAELKARRLKSGYSADPNSEWQKLDRQIDATLEDALERAGQSADLLLKIAREAYISNPGIAISAAERAVRSKPSAESHFALAKGLKWKAFVADEPEKGALRESAKMALQSALRLASQPNEEIYYHLGDVIEDLGSHTDAETNFRHAFELSKRSGNSEIMVNSLRGLARTAFVLGKHSESETWFRAIVDTGKASAWDWQQHGKRLDETSRHQEAGVSFRYAAQNGGDWTNWCQSAHSFYMSRDADMTLSCARECVKNGSGNPQSEEWLALAHYMIGDTLNERGVLPRGA